MGAWLGRFIVDMIEKKEGGEIKITEWAGKSKEREERRGKEERR